MARKKPKGVYEVGIIDQGWPDTFNVFQCLNP